MRVALVLFLCAPVLAAQGGSTGPAPRSLLAPTGTLRAVFLATNPVQGRVDPQSGATSGPAPDLVRELARRLAVPYVITPLPDAAAVLDAVTRGNADIGFLAYEAARAAQVEFSTPYSLMASAYAVRADSPIKTTAEVDRAGVKIGAVKGQSQEIFVSANVKHARLDVRPVVPPSDALAAMLISGEIDAFAANRGRMEDLARMFPRVRVLPDNFLVVGQAIVVNKGESARRDELNRFLSEVRASGFVKSSIASAGVAGVEAAP